MRRWHCARNERRKSGRGKPDINDVHYWFAVMLPWEGDFAWSFEAPFGEGASNGNERQCRSCSFACWFLKVFERRNDEKLEKVAVPLSGHGPRRRGTTIL